MKRQFSKGWIALFLIAICLLLVGIASADSTSGDFYYRITTGKNPVAVITGYKGAGGEVTVPSTIKAEDNKIYTVTSIDRMESIKIKSIIIPNTVTQFGHNAFKNCYNLQSVYPLTSVKYYGVGVFMNCCDLQSVSLSGMESTSIPNEMFSGCESLVSVTIPSGVLSIDEMAFQGCSSLTSIYLPDTITTIYEKAFYQCTSLKTVHLSTALTNIGDNAFAGCSKLETINIPATLTKVGESVFSNAGPLSNVTIQSGMLWIPEKLFYNSGITSITFPSSIRQISYGAFDSCKNLEEITIPKQVGHIDSDTFRNCTSLKNVTILGTVTTIFDRAFYGCTSLKSISLPDSVKGIYYNAFAKCGLETFTFPKDVKEIEGGILYGCSNLKKVTLPENVTRIPEGTFKECTSLSSFDIPDTVSEIEDFTFFGCTSLSSIGIPATVTSIGDQAFSDCTKLKTISMPASLKTIGEAAFSGCTGATEITLEKGITEIGKKAFKGCVSLADLFFEGNETEWNSIKLGEEWKKETASGFKVHCRCTVTFDANGHGTAPEALKNIWSNYTITQPSDLTAEGYTFTGWYSDQYGNNKWDFSKYCPTGDTVIYAGWQKNEQAEEEPEADPIEEQEEEESKDPVDINEAVITKIPDQAYTGKAIQPAFTVTYGGKTLVEGTDFYVSWRDNKKIGKATLIIAGMDDFEGAKQTTFKIIPQSVKLSSLKAGKKSLTVKWKKGSKIDGYEIQYSLKSNFKSAKKITITGASTKKVEIEGLKKKKTYYVRIRTFKKVGSKKYYSEWSEVKSKKTK